ncbi:MAG: acetyl-CoA carboxylase biotin carboxyl carrier protein [Blastocatellia bacterium]|nr:acetyl-CoA carboxylase biotin carboxyl carrier protein [Blastocatellia bacterium]
MDFTEIKELIELVSEKKLAEFEVEQGDFRLKIKRDAESSPVTTSSVTAAEKQVVEKVEKRATPAPVVVATKESKQPETKEPDNLHIVKTPIVGTFYRSPSPTSEPFVKKGDKIQVGKVLCIIEAMKLMNEIESDVSGEVVDIYVENASPVEYGQPLFGIRRG